MTHWSMRHLRYDFASMRHSSSLVPLWAFKQRMYWPMTALHSPGVMARQSFAFSEYPASVSNNGNSRV